MHPGPLSLTVEQVKTDGYGYRLGLRKIKGPFRFDRFSLVLPGPVRGFSENCAWGETSRAFPETVCLLGFCCGSEIGFDRTRD
jgi:hypothetical protein